MRPSVVLDMKRSAVREAVGRFRTATPRIFGSVLHGTDRDGSDIDLLVDALPGATLLDLGDLEIAAGRGRRFADARRPAAEVPGQGARGGTTGMSENRLPDYIDHTQQAAADACSFVEGLSKDDFLADKRTQQAVIMNFIVIGEAATKVLDGYAEFTQAHPEVPWRSMRNIRNRMSHGYFDINLDVVWERRHKNGYRHCSNNCPQCARMSTTTTVTTKAWNHDQRQQAANVRSLDCVRPGHPSAALGQVDLNELSDSQAFRETGSRGRNGHWQLHNNATNEFQPPSPYRSEHFNRRGYVHMMITMSAVKRSLIALIVWTSTLPAWVFPLLWITHSPLDLAAVTPFSAWVAFFVVTIQWVTTSKVSAIAIVAGWMSGIIFFGIVMLLPSTKWIDSLGAVGVMCLYSSPALCLAGYLTWSRFRKRAVASC